MTGTMGSERFYAEQMDDRGVHFALIYDLVGHDVSVPAEMVPGVGGLLAKVPGLRGKDIAIPHLRHLLFMTGAESHPRLPGLVDGAEMPKKLKLKLMATLNEYVGDMSDHGVFRRNGVPYLFFSCGRWAHAGAGRTTTWRRTRPTGSTTGRWRGSSCSPPTSWSGRTRRKWCPESLLRTRWSSRRGR